MQDLYKRILLDSLNVFKTVLPSRKKNKQSYSQSTLVENYLDKEEHKKSST